MKAIALVLLALVPADTVIPAGTHIPIRFVQRVTSGRDTVGTPVLVQTMGAVVRDSCVIVPPYLRAKGHVVVSKGGGRFGRHGRLGLRFDSLEVRPGRWAAVSAVLDTLEYAPRGGLADSGLVSSGKTSIVGVGKKLVPAGVAAAVDLDAVPAAVLGGFSLVRRGPPVRIMAGEIGGIRLTEPPLPPREDRGEGLAAPPAPAGMPPPPKFAPRPRNRPGARPGVPLHLPL